MVLGKSIELMMKTCLLPRSVMPMVSHALLFVDIFDHEYGRCRRARSLASLGRASCVAQGGFGAVLGKQGILKGYLMGFGGIVWGIVGIRCIYYYRMNF